MLLCVNSQVTCVEIADYLNFRCKLQKVGQLDQNSRVGDRCVCANS